MGQQGFGRWQSSERERDQPGLYAPAARTEQTARDKADRRAPGRHGRALPPPTAEPPSEREQPQPSPHHGPSHSLTWTLHPPPASDATALPEALAQHHTVPPHLAPPPGDAVARAPPLTDGTGARAARRELGAARGWRRSGGGCGTGLLGMPAGGHGCRCAGTEATAPLCPVAHGA